MKINAIIMAAGMSTRFVPLSLEKPKALLTIKGEVLIERQIRQLREAGIEEIIIVVGYQKEKFQYLEQKYNVVIIENPYYEVRNNHSTLFVAREYLGNTFICSGDNYFQQNVFEEKSPVPYYSAVYENGDTGEWCLKTDDTGKILNVTVGGKDTWVMKGHVFFTSEFSEFLKPHLIAAMETEDAKSKFWEDLYIEHIENSDMYIKKYSDGIIEEFDSLEELRQFDKEYITNSGCEMIKDLCAKLNCSENELCDFSPVKSEGKVIGFTFRLHEKEYEFSINEGLLKNTIV